MGIFDKIFGTHSERELKRIYPIVDKVEGLRDSMMALSDEALQAKTKEFKNISILLLPKRHKFYIIIYIVYCVKAQNSY